MILWIDPGIRKLWYALIASDLTIVDAWVLLLKWKSEKTIKEQETDTVSMNQRQKQELPLTPIGIKMWKRLEQRNRMDEIFAFFERMLSKYPGQIDCVCVEKLYFTERNQSNAEYVFGIRWALMMLFYRHGVVLQEYTPMQLKKYITWNAKAGKDLVMAVVKNLFWLSEKIQRHDTADALGLAYLASKTL